MKTAYVVLSHQHPEQVLRLVRTLRAGSPSCTVVLHHDDRRTRVDEAALRALGVERVLPATAVTWGAASQLEALLRSLRWALERVEFEWLTVLSGQDYPVRPLERIEREWRDSGVEGFVEGVPVEPPGWTRDAGDEFARRYFYRYRRARSAPRRVIAAARPLLAVRDMPAGTLVGVRRPGPGIPVRRGSDWLTLSRRAVAAVTGVAPELVRYYRRTLLPTESLPHSVLYASGLPLSGDPRRYSAWAPGAAHPALLEDLDPIVASGADFARKFEPGAPVLDALDRVVLG